MVHHPKKGKFESHLRYSHKPIKRGLNSPFFLGSNGSCVGFASVFVCITIIMLDKNEVPKPQKEPRLVVPGATSKDQRRILKWWVWDERINGFSKQKETFPLSTSVTDMNIKVKNIYRLVFVKNYYINRDGELVPPKQTEKERQVKVAESMRIGDLITEAIAEKRLLNRKDSTIKTLETHCDVFIQWLISTKRHNFPIAYFSENILNEFIKYLMDGRNDGPRTRNNYKASIENIFNYAVRKKWLPVNPCAEIVDAIEPSGRNIAYQFDQQEELIHLMQEKYQWWLLGAMTMYFSLMRTNELTSIQIKSIGMYNEDQIFLAGDESKNIDHRHVTIPWQLMEMFKEYGIFSYPKDYYLFGVGCRPGPKRYDSDYLGHRYRANILDRLKYPKDYTFYSWKHTGVVSLHKAGVKDVDIFQQGGWRDWRSFRFYMKSLGLFSNDGIKNNSPTPPGLKKEARYTAGL